MQTEMVRTRNKILRACQDNPAGHSTRMEKEADRKRDGRTTSRNGMMLGAAMRKGERREDWRELAARSSVAPQQSNRIGIGDISSGDSFLHSLSKRLYLA